MIIKTTHLYFIAPVLAVIISQANRSILTTGPVVAGNTLQGKLHSFLGQNRTQFIKLYISIYSFIILFLEIFIVYLYTQLDFNLFIIFLPSVILSLCLTWMLTKKIINICIVKNLPLKYSEFLKLIVLYLILYRFIILASLIVLTVCVSGGTLNDLVALTMILKYILIAHIWLSIIVLGIYRIFLFSYDEILSKIKSTFIKTFITIVCIITFRWLIVTCCHLNFDNISDAILIIFSTGIFKEFILPSSLNPKKRSWGTAINEETPNEPQTAGPQIAENPESSTSGDVPANNYAMHVGVNDPPVNTVNDPTVNPVNDSQVNPFIDRPLDPVNANVEPFPTFRTHAESDEYKTRRATRLLYLRSFANEDRDKFRDLSPTSRVVAEVEARNKAREAGIGPVETTLLKYNLPMAGFSYANALYTPYDPMDTRNEPTWRTFPTSKQPYCGNFANATERMLIENNNTPILCEQLQAQLSKEDYAYYRRWHSRMYGGWGNPKVTPQTITDLRNMP